MSEPSRRGFVPYDLDGVPHRIWMKALWMVRGDTSTARRLARLLDESILPIVEDGERVLGARTTAMILLERGVHELLGKIENKQLGRLTHRHRKKRAPALTQTIAVVTWRGRAREPERRGTWLGLCGPEQVTWTVDGARIPNEVIAQQTLMEAAAEGIAPPIENGCEMPRVVATGDGDGIDLEAYVRGHLSHCGRLPHGATCLGTIRSTNDVDRARQIPGSFAIQDENEDWLLFRLSTESDGPAA
jgi:hypothetical protein